MSVLSRLIPDHIPLPIIDSSAGISSRTDPAAIVGAAAKENRGKAIVSTPPPRIDTLTRHALAKYFRNTWELQDLLFRAVGEESAFYRNPDPLRNVLIFYLGHPAAFYINKLRQAGMLEAPIDEEFERIFAVGVDPARASELSDRLDAALWPPVRAVWEYRSRVYETVLEVLARLPLEHRNTEDSPLWAFLMAVEHDRIHFETSSMLIRQLPESWLVRPPGWQYAPATESSEPNPLVLIPPGEVVLGKKLDHPTFGWDNEYGELPLAVPAFYASRFLVSNREFLDFVRGGGYEKREYWDDESWRWRMANEVNHPKFWQPQASGFSYRAMFDLLPLPLSWPVEVNYFEAAAYCRAVGCRLPSEGEWNRITADHDGARRHLPGNDPMFGGRHNLNLRFGSPSAIDASPASVFGLYDTYGNVWQWLSNDFAPLPGFAIHDFYPDFSRTYFDSEHKMLAGGSWATTGTGASKFYRLWFRKHFYQHAGFRLARDT